MSFIFCIFSLFFSFSFIFFLYFFSADPEQGPTKQELLDLLKNCDLAGASSSNSIVSSRTPSPSPSLLSIMYPGYKPVNVGVSRIDTPISTPIMQHNASQPNHMQTPYYGELNDPSPSSPRLSGVFSGSNLSLNENITGIPQHEMDGENGRDAQNVSLYSQLLQDDSTNEASVAAISRSSTKHLDPSEVKIPNRPMSSSEVLEAETNNELYLLRRVSSDTTRPVTKKHTSKDCKDATLVPAVNNRNDLMEKKTSSLASSEGTNEL